MWFNSQYPSIWTAPDCVVRTTHLFSSSFHPTFAYSSFRICCVCNSSYNTQSSSQTRSYGEILPLLPFLSWYILQLSHFSSGPNGGLAQSPEFQPLDSTAVPRCKHNLLQSDSAWMWNNQLWLISGGSDTDPTAPVPVVMIRILISGSFW